MLVQFSHLALTLVLFLPLFLFFLHTRVDLVLHSGDIVDIRMDDMEVSTAVEAERRQQVEQVISKLTVCAKGAPVYYIPGNVSNNPIH